MMIKKNAVKLLVVLAMVWIVGGCAKKVMAPEVEGAAGAGAGADTSASITDKGAGSGSGAGSGAGSSGGSAGGDFGGGAPTDNQVARSLDFKPTTDLGDIYFAFDKYDMSDVSKKTLQKNADWLKQHPDVKVQIEGHCDERGTSNYNLGLGERRAVSTKKFLATLGIDEGRQYTISYGKEKPVCSEHKESCWQQNRRAHFLVSK